MPRSQNAHAIVNAGFMMKFHHNSPLLENMTIVYGGISPKFVHATKTERVIVGKDPYTEESLQLALSTLSEELQPKEAHPEPSAEYRKILAILHGRDLTNESLPFSSYTPVGCSST